MLVPVTRILTGLLLALLAIAISTLKIVFLAVPAGGVKLTVTAQVLLRAAALVQLAWLALNLLIGLLPLTAVKLKALAFKLNAAVPLLVRVNLTVPVFPAAELTEAVLAAKEIVP